jgi:hypothetical protein
MTAFLKASTWIWIAGVFIVIKCIFKYLAWLYHDKDKPLRDAVRQAQDYLSQHTYFEVARAALQRLYNRLAGIFQKRTRFLYLFLFFLLLNAASLWLGKYFFGFDSSELEALTTDMNRLAHVSDQLKTIDMIDSTMHPVMSMASVFQLTLIDLSSFQFTMGIIWPTCRTLHFCIQISVKRMLSDLKITWYENLRLKRLQTNTPGYFVALYIAILLGSEVRDDHIERRIIDDPRLFL